MFVCVCVCVRKRQTEEKYSSDERNKLRSNITYKGNETQRYFIYTLLKKLCHEIENKLVVLSHLQQEEVEMLWYLFEQDFFYLLLICHRHFHHYLHLP